MFGLKIFGPRKFWIWKKNWGSKKSLKKEIQGKKFSKKIVGPKNFDLKKKVKTRLIQVKLVVKTNFDLKKKVKNNLVRKNVGFEKNCWSETILGSKEIFSSTFFSGPIKFLV